MDYLILKRTGETGLAQDWTPTQIAHVDGEGAEAEAEACRQGYTGEGRYKAVPWPGCGEYNLGSPGPPEATPVTTGEEGSDG